MPLLGGLARSASRIILCVLLIRCGGEAEFQGGPPIEKAKESNEATVAVDDPLDVGGPSEKPPTTAEIPVDDDQIPLIEEPPAIVDIQLPLSAYDRVIWHWACAENSNEEVFPASEVEAVVKGSGIHGFDPAELPDSEIVMSGTLCAPEERKRDLVFVVDVSGSMLTNDPLVNGSCGRLRAIDAAVANAANDGAVQIGILTFSSDIVASSSKLFSTIQEVNADLNLVQPFAEVICGQAGGTNYTAGMTGAAQLLSGGREDAMKEIYFISDGQPEEGLKGIAEADALRNPGVWIGQSTNTETIATIMLGVTDTVLESQIASLDYNGMPLHAFANDASTLASTLAALADNRIVTAEVMYRTVGTRQWTRIDVMDYLLDYAYTLPPIKLSKLRAPGGFELVYQYQDRHGNLYTEHGKIAWRNKPRKTCHAVFGTTDCIEQKE